MAFTQLGLSEPIVLGVRAAGYTTPTPIQAQAIPIATGGRDLIGCAQTGTGKTAAFVLPMLHRLNENGGRGNGRRAPRALVLTPTRELAVQVEEAVVAYGRFAGLRSTAVYGGVGYGPQLQALRRGVDIVIATPGRLIDLMNRRDIDLSRIEIFVLDEADRMFDMGFINDVKKIVATLPVERQTLLFSATMEDRVVKLAAAIQKNPERVEVGQRRNPAESVTQHVYAISKESKMDLLHHILANETMDSVIIFSRTKHGADRIASRLTRGGIPAAALHSDRTQNQRLKALDGFRQGRFQVLVATDIAARGIDIDGVSHVINFDTPGSPEDYIHRIGRTGRAESIGNAITFVSYAEEPLLRRMEQHIGKRFRRGGYPGFTPSKREEIEFTPARSESSSSGNRFGGSAERRSSDRPRDERWSEGGGRFRSDRSTGRNDRREPSRASVSRGSDRRDAGGRGR